jgi:hypothetical protein
MSATKMATLFDLAANATSPAVRRDPASDAVVRTKMQRRLSDWAASGKTFSAVKRESYRWR